METNYARFFNTAKSSATNLKLQLGLISGLQKNIIWNSRKNGTFVKALHGELKDIKN